MPDEIGKVVVMATVGPPEPGPVISTLTIKKTNIGLLQYQGDSNDDSSEHNFARMRGF